MGMYKITNLPRAIDNIPALSELALRTYPKVDGLGIAFMYDTLGMSADEAEDFLTYVKELLKLTDSVCFGPNVICTLVGT